MRNPINVGRPNEERDTSSSRGQRVLVQQGLRTFLHAAQEDRRKLQEENKALRGELEKVTGELERVTRELAIEKRKISPYSLKLSRPTRTSSARGRLFSSPPKELLSSRSSRRSWNDSVIIPHSPSVLQR